MFVVTTDPQFTHPVTVCVPTDGGHIEQTLKATFRVVPDGELAGDLSEASQIADLQKLIVRLDDLVDADKNAVSYSDQLRDQLLRLPYVRMALSYAYVRGVTKAKAGN